MSVDGIKTSVSLVWLLASVEVDKVGSLGSGLRVSRAAPADGAGVVRPKVISIKQLHHSRGRACRLTSLAAASWRI